MVKRCAWGLCNVDVRYPERLQGTRLIQFVKPHIDLETCKRWIKACGRPHSQLNLTNITGNKVICAKHFVGGDGPTKEHPDPVPADGSPTTKSRKSPKKRNTDYDETGTPILKRFRTSSALKENNELLSSHEERAINGVHTQTESPWVSAMEMFTLTAENMHLKGQIKVYEEKISLQERSLRDKQKEIKILKEKLSKKPIMSVMLVRQKESKLNNLFQYYTGITYVRFLALLNFLLPSGKPLISGYGRNDIKKLSNIDGIFLTLVRIRHAFGLKDMAFRFGISAQSSGIVFNKWLDVLYYKLGQLSIWSHRDQIIEQMPSEYKKDFPTSLVIIDGTEIKTQVPSALGLQSQLYSDYKSSTTLKALIGCDPNGCVMFVSELFTGSISDKAIREQSGFYDLLKVLKEHKYVQEGDAIMVDKGFNIAGIILYKKLAKLFFYLKKNTLFVKLFHLNKRHTQPCKNNVHL